MMLLLLVLGCAQPLHMQYDYGRAYMAIAETQANLDRPSAADADYPMSGQEALDIRSNAEKATTEEKSGKIETTKTEGK